MVRVGVVGLGYWGPNLVRVLSGFPDCEVTALCDLNPRRLHDFQRKFPAVRMATTCVSDLLSSDVVDAVIIATPTKTHFALAAEALRNGLHCFVEKPLATSSRRLRPVDRPGRGGKSVALRGARFSLLRARRQAEGNGQRRPARRPVLHQLLPPEPGACPPRRSAPLGPGAARRLHHARPGGQQPDPRELQRAGLL